MAGAATDSGDDLCQPVAVARLVGTGISRGWAHGLRRFSVPMAALFAGLLAMACASADAACPGPALELAELAPGVWQAVADGGSLDANPANRGFVANLLAVRDGTRLWLLGSGPSPAFGRRLACQLRARTGVPVSDVIDPWPRPELVLGNRAFPGARRWAHADVAAAMHARCPRCVARLQGLLGDAASDLGPDPILLPTQLLHGDSGRLGPFQWWRLQRAPQVPVTVWRLVARPLWAAPGLLWAAGAPDLRDAELATMQRSTAALRAISAADGAAAHWLPEQGPLQDAEAPARHAAYWEALDGAIEAALERGALEVDVPAALQTPPGAPALPAAMTSGQRHALNWQRAWREVERRWMETPDTQ